MTCVSKNVAFLAFALLINTINVVDASRMLKEGSSQNFTQVATASGSNSQGFVTVNGKEFYLDGRPWHCAGSNAYYAAITDRLSAEDVDTLFKVRFSQIFFTFAACVFSVPLRAVDFFSPCFIN
jgi:hypothetical protein